MAEVNGRLFQGKDATAGGYVLEVKSAEDRKKAKEQLAAPKTAPPPKAFTPTSDEIKPVAPPAPPKGGG